MEGVQSTLARVAQIQTRFAALAPAPRTRAVPPTTATSFEQALAEATSAADASAAPTAAPATTALTPATKRAPGQYGKVQPPADLAGYGNGRIPESRLTPIAGGERLWAPAANAYRQLSTAAARDGIKIGVNDGYRDYADQQRVARQKGLYSQGGLAAVPGTSDHGWGLSVDLELDGRAQQWMRDNASRFGFVEDVAREPWHWTYRPD